MVSSSSSSPSSQSHVEPHTLDLLLQNTLQLHRQFIDGQPSLLQYHPQQQEQKQSSLTTRLSHQSPSFSGLGPSAFDNSFDLTSCSITPPPHEKGHRRLLKEKQHQTSEQQPKQLELSGFLSSSSTPPSSSSSLTASPSSPLSPRSFSLNTRPGKNDDKSTATTAASSPAPPHHQHLLSNPEQQTLSARHQSSLPILSDDFFIGSSTRSSPSITNSLATTPTSPFRPSIFNSSVLPIHIKNSGNNNGEQFQPHPCAHDNHRRLQHLDSGFGHEHGHGHNHSQSLVRSTSSVLFSPAETTSPHPHKKQTRHRVQSEPADLSYFLNQQHSGVSSKTIASTTSGAINIPQLSSSPTWSSSVPFHRPTSTSESPRPLASPSESKAPSSPLHQRCKTNTCSSNNNRSSFPAFPLQPLLHSLPSSPTTGPFPSSSPQHLYNVRLASASLHLVTSAAVSASETVPSPRRKESAMAASTSSSPSSVYSSQFPSHIQRPQSLAQDITLSSPTTKSAATAGPGAIASGETIASSFGSNTAASTAGGTTTNMTHQQTIPVHVRYVPKDLWVQVDMPLDISIQQAKDLILTRCRLYSMPPRPVSPVTLPVTSVAASTASTAMTSDEPDELSRGKDLNKSQARHFQMLTRPPEQDEDNCILRHGDLLLANDSGHGGSFEDESFNDDQMSLDDDEAELCAEALMVSEDDDDGDDGGDDKNDVDKVNFHAPSRRSILMVSNPNIGEDLDSGIAVVVPTKLSVTGSGPIIGSAAGTNVSPGISGTELFNSSTTSIFPVSKSTDTHKPSRLTEAVLQGLSSFSFVTSRTRQVSHGSASLNLRDIRQQQLRQDQRRPLSSPTPLGLNQHQLRQLLSHSSGGSSSKPDRVGSPKMTWGNATTMLSTSSSISTASTASSTSNDSSSNSSSSEGGGDGNRFSHHIPGWNYYRSRQQSNHHKRRLGEYLDREIHEHGGLLADCLAAEEEEEEVSRTGSATMNTQSQCPVSELGRESHCLSPELLYARKERCTAWQASFGLFWLAAGHWLDDSRQVGSYPLQSHCVIELQLKSHYIHLPRMARDNDICCQSGAGSDAQSLDYYDHYAEGTLFKKSKQAMIASATSADRERESKDWKERWVVLRGNRLIIYHKRKNTTKKVIDLRPPVSVQTTVLPYPTTRKHTGGSVCSGQRSALSSTMITLTVPSNPATPKIYFRASGESELNHWIRIFNSLNSPNRACPTLTSPSTNLLGTSLSANSARALSPPPPPLPAVPPPSTLPVMLPPLEHFDPKLYGNGNKRSSPSKPLKSQRRSYWGGTSSRDSFMSSSSSSSTAHQQQVKRTRHHTSQATYLSSSTERLKDLTQIADHSSSFSEFSQVQERAAATPLPEMEEDVILGLKIQEITLMRSQSNPWKNRPPPLSQGRDQSQGEEDKSVNTKMVQTRRGRSNTMHTEPSTFPRSIVRTSSVSVTRVSRPDVPRSSLLVTPTSSQPSTPLGNVATSSPREIKSSIDPNLISKAATALSNLTTAMSLPTSPASESPTRTLREKFTECTSWEHSDHEHEGDDEGDKEEENLNGSSSNRESCLSDSATLQGIPVSSVVRHASMTSTLVGSVDLSSRRKKRSSVEVGPKVTASVNTTPSKNINNTGDSPVGKKTPTSTTMPSRVRALGEVLSQKLAQSSCSLASSTVKSARSVGGRSGSVSSLREFFIQKTKAAASTSNRAAVQSCQSSPVSWSPNLNVEGGVTLQEASMSASSSSSPLAILGHYFEGYLWLYVRNTPPLLSAREQHSWSESGISTPEDQTIQPLRWPSSALATTSSLPSRWRTRSTGGAPPSSYSTADESAGWPSQYLPRSVSSGSLNAGATGIDKASLRSTATTKSNVSSAHASGRYVRCWVTIDQHGEFRWAEAPVKASTLPEKEHSSNRNINTELSDRGSKGGQDRDDQMPSPAFGLKLSTKFTSGSSPSTTGARPTESISPRLPRAGVQVAMAQKLRLYFFSVKVTVSSVVEALLVIQVFGGRCNADSDGSREGPTETNHDCAFTRHPSQAQTRSSPMLPMWPSMYPMRQNHLSRTASVSAALKKSSESMSISSTHSQLATPVTVPTTPTLSRCSSLSGDIPMTPAAVSSLVRHTSMILSTSRRHSRNNSSAGNRSHGLGHQSALSGSRTPTKASRVSLFAENNVRHRTRSAPVNICSLSSAGMITASSSTSLACLSSLSPFSGSPGTGLSRTAKRTEDSPVHFDSLFAAMNAVSSSSSGSSNQHSVVGIQLPFRIDSVEPNSQVLSLAQNLQNAAVNNLLSPTTATSRKKFRTQSMSSLKSSWTSTSASACGSGIEGTDGGKDATLLSAAIELKRAGSEGVLRMRSISLQDVDEETEDELEREEHHECVDMKENRFSDLGNEDSRAHVKARLLSLSATPLSPSRMSRARLQNPSLSEIMAVKRSSVSPSAPAVASATAVTLATLEGSRNKTTVLQEMTMEQKTKEEEGERLRQRRQEQEAREEDRRVRAMEDQVKEHCPFLDIGFSSTIDESNVRKIVLTLKGYTETEQEWVKLQSCLKQFTDIPVIDHRCALPPENTVIPSYHAPSRPLSRK